MIQPDFMEWISRGCRFVYPFLYLFAGAISYHYRNLSRRLILVVIGFVCAGIMALLGQLQLQTMSPSHWPILAVLFSYRIGVLVSLMYVCGICLMVFGLYLSLADLHKQL